MSPFVREVSSRRYAAARGILEFGVVLGGMALFAFAWSALP